MKKHIKDQIITDFPQEDQQAVQQELESITLEHVMAASQGNLDNTWLAILKLSKGNIEELKKLVQAAKEDFRDVIYWASLE